MAHFADEGGGVVVDSCYGSASGDDDGRAERRMVLCRTRYQHIDRRIRQCAKRIRAPVVSGAVREAAFGERLQLSVRHGPDQIEERPSELA